MVPPRFLCIFLCYQVSRVLSVLLRGLPVGASVPSRVAIEAPFTYCCHPCRTSFAAQESRLFEGLKVLPYIFLRISNLDEFTNQSLITVMDLHPPAATNKHNVNAPTGRRATAQMGAVDGGET